MANLSTSASCVADGRLGVSVSASVSQGEQSIDGNYTTVNYSYSASQAGSLGFSGTTRSNAGALVLIINGQTVVNVALPLTHGISVGQGITSGSGSVRVAHNSDGSKKASIELKIVAGSDPRGANYYWGSSSTSGSITLTNIPRASYPTLSASSKTLGETIGITTNRKSGNFTHSLWWMCGNSGWQGIASGVGDSYSWTIPRDIANRITSSTSATITIVCRTYSGNTQIGSDQTVSFTGNVPSDIKPSASGLSVSEAVSAIKTKFGVYLKGQSKLAISFSESGSYGSWITSRKIECNNQTFWSTSATTDYLYTSGSLKVTATVTDSRGRSASISTTVTVYDYSSPWVNALKGIRCNSDGTNADDGEYLKIQFSAGVASVSSKNSATYQLGYRLSNSGNYTYKTLDLSALSYSDTTTGVISGLKFAMDKTYDIVLVVTDKIGLEARRSDVVSTAFELVNYYPDGSGMAIGKFAESSNLFDVGMDAKYRKAIYADNGICAGDSTYFGAPIYGANDATAWVHLGTWTSGGDAHNCMITIFTGAGYNGGASQNTTVKINIKDGWQGSLSASSSFGITYEITGNYYSDIKVKGIAQAHDILDVWIYLPWTYWNGDYIFQGHGTWKHIATNQSAEPTGNVQDCAEMPVLTRNNFLSLMRDSLYPIGAVYTTYNNNSPRNFLGGTWVQFGQGRVLLGVGSGDSTHTFKEATTGGLYEDSSLRAAIGAFGNDISAIGYSLSARIKGITYGYGLHASSVERDIEESRINHATIVKRENGENPSLVQPYITAYFWRRTA